MGTVGARIYNPMELSNYKSVYVKRWNKPCSTSFLISMQFRTLALFMEYGVFEYTPEIKKKRTYKEVINYGK